MGNTDLIKKIMAMGHQNNPKVVVEVLKCFQSIGENVIISFL